MLAGCSQLGNLSERDKVQQQWLHWQQAVQPIDRWDVHARAVVKLEAGVYHVGIRWRHERQGFVILLEAPFGQGVFRIETSSESALYRLSLPDGQVYQNASTEALLEEVIGWSIPLSGLEFWIRGLPRPDSVYSHRSAAEGMPLSINQDGWSIRYLDYFASLGSPGLPRKMQLARDDLTLKLVIERWQQNESDQIPSGLFPVFD